MFYAVHPAGQIAPNLVVPTNWVITPTSAVLASQVPIATLNTLIVTPGTTITDSNGNVLLQVPNSNGTVTPVPASVTAAVPIWSPANQYFWPAAIGAGVVGLVVLGMVFGQHD